MSVKEILQSLVDDGMVDSDKIGTSIYFWAFPSKASQNVSWVIVGCVYTELVMFKLMFLVSCILVVM